MKTRSFLPPGAFVLLIFGGTLSSLQAQSTAFTYQGRLQNDGSPANGLYNLAFTLYTNSSGSGTPVAGPVTNNGVAVSNGEFTVTVDFGANVWNGATNWLQIGVESNDAASFTTLSPLQEVTPTPYAVYASGASNLLGTIQASQLAGTLPSANLSGTYTNAVTFTATRNQFIGSFSGDGAGLTGLANGAGLSTNLVPPGAVFDANGNYALSGITVGAEYYIHIGGTNDAAYATNSSGMWRGDRYVYYSNSTFIEPVGTAGSGNDSNVVAGSNTFYLVGTTAAAGSNVFSRIYLLNTNNLTGTNTVAGNFNGTFTGMLSGGTSNSLATGLANNYGFVQSNNVYVLYIPPITAGAALQYGTIDNLGHGGTGNTIELITQDPTGGGYSAVGFMDSNLVERMAIGFASPAISYYDDTYFPYGAPYIEDGSGAYSIFFVNYANINGGEISTNTSGVSGTANYHNWTWFDATTGSYEAVTNYAHVIFDARQIDNTVYVQNLAISNSAIFSNAPTFAHTNAAPSDPNVPKLWIDFTNGGQVYKIPAYQ